MSKAVGSFLRGGIAILGTATFWQGMLINAGLAVAFGAASSLLRKKPKLAIQPLYLDGGVSDPLAGLPLVYGSARITARPVFYTVTDSKRHLWIVGALAHGPVAGIDEIYLDGNPVIDANQRTDATVLVAGEVLNYVGYAHAWKAYGTDGQVTIVETARGAKTVTSTTNSGDNRGKIIITSTAHGYAIGDIVEFTSVSGAPAQRGFGVVDVESTVKFTVLAPEYGPIDWGNSGTVDHYTPELPSIFGSLWTANHNGKGVAYIVLRLLYDEQRFANGFPKIEANVRGIVARDPRDYHTTAIATTAVGGAVTGLASTAIANTTGAHGLAEGDFVMVLGHSKTELNGRQRVDRVTDTDTFVIHALLSGAGTGGTIEPLTYTTNPAVCIRDYLSNPVYGLGAEDAELDDTNIELEANYHDEMVDVPIANDDAFSNQREILSAVGDGVNVTYTLALAHPYTVAQTIFVYGFADADNITGLFTIASFPSSTQVRITLARTGSWTPLTFSYQFYGNTKIVNMGSMSALTQQARHSCSGILDTTQSLKANLEDLLACCRGNLIYQGGVYRSFTRRVVTASPLILSEANIIGGWEFVLPGASDVANIVRATYPDARLNGVMTAVDYPTVGLGNGFLEDDNFLELRRDLELRLVNNRPQAQQIATVTRRESRNPIACAVTCTEAALALSVGDVVPVTHSTPGWVLKKFWVAAITCTPDAQVRLVLHEYDETAYDLDAQDDDPFAPDTTLDGPSSSDAITVPDVTASVVYTTSDRGEQANIRLAFDQPLETNYRRMEWQVRSRAPGASTFDGGSVTMPGSVMGPDLIPATFATEYQVVPVAVSIAGTRTVGSALDVIVVVERSAPTPSYATPVATSNYIEYGISAYDDETKLIEVWSQTSTASMSGTSIYKASTATRYNDFNKGDGILIIQLSVDATNDWRKTTFAPFDKDGNPGPLTTFVTERATPSPPGAPGSWAVQSNPSPWTGTIIRRVTLNGSAVAGWKVRTYRDAVVYGSDRTLVAGDITNTYVDVTDSGVLSNTSYLYKDSHLNAGVEGATNTETSLTTGTSGSLTTPSLTATRNANQCDDDLEWDAAGNPEGTTYHIERSTTGSGSGFSELTTIADALAISVSAALVTQWYRVWASADGYTDTGYSNVETTDAGGDCV